MKKIQTLIVLLFFSAVYSQQNQTPDSVQVIQKEKDFFVRINNKTYPLNLDSGFEDFERRVELNKTGQGFELVLTMQQGNAYQVFHNFYSKKDAQYFLHKSYAVYSTRNEYTLSGKFTSESAPNNFTGIDDMFGSGDVIEIQHVTGFQDEKPATKYSLYNLVKTNYEKGLYKRVLVLTDPFVIDECGIVNDKNPQLINDMAYYAYKAGGYTEAIYILQNLIKKYPQREVAYLNLADSQWELNDKANAIINYNKYIELMEKEGKKEKIPGYVLLHAKQ